jgi:metal-responsive CopG/Arc/MetJ family transcriptional regulator
MAKAKEPTENVSVNMSIDLLEHLDSFCATHPLSLNRSQAIVFAIKGFLALEESKNPDFWDDYKKRHQ